jgi:2-polyprenyl-3-methyl-5-hydroxy-6-metoxy-1,4-benzoquinol methylase
MWLIAQNGMVAGIHKFMYHLHTHCRACGYASSGPQGIKSAQNEKLIEVLDLGVQPLANDFCKAGDEHAGYAPLKVMLCPRCSLAQLSVVVDPKILYSHYSYVTSPSETMRSHFGLLISDIRKETDGDTVLEIGSNDGRLLAMMQSEGFSVSGVDPADNLVELARSHGIQTQCGFFSEETSRLLPKYDIVIARHVFCHVDNWKDFVRGLEAISHKNTLICIEAPYVDDTLKNCEFDQIYHEHLSFMSLKAMMFLLEGTSLHLHKVIKYDIHGGVVLLMIRHNDYEKKPVGAFSENITIERWKEFSTAAKDQINRLVSTVMAAKSQGRRVAGLGASAKSTVWANACHFTKKEIEFISDNTPQKQLTFSPGSEIPIVDEGAIIRELPDYVIMWCWNYREEVLLKFAAAREKGVKFIIPVKTIEVV